MIERFQKFSFAISEISRHWHKSANDEMEKIGLKANHSVYLMALHHYKDGLTAPELCRVCSKDKSDVSRMMAIMENKGFAVKEGVNQNLYRGVFKLTNSGKEAAIKLENRVALAVELAGKDLTDENRTIFYDALDIIALNLRTLNENGLPQNQF